MTFHIVHRISFEVQTGNERLGCTCFLLHILTQSSSQDCRRRSPPKSFCLLRCVRSPTIQSSVHQMESRSDVTKGQWHRRVEWIPDENIPSSCALSPDQFEIGEEGNYQPRRPALHIFKQLLPVCLLGFLKDLQDRHHKAEWPTLQLTRLPKTQERPSRRARSRHKVVWFDASLRHVPSVFPMSKPSLP